MNKKWCIVICTKDRPRQLSFLLDDLSLVLKETKIIQAKIIIVNDSTEEQFVNATNLVCKKFNRLDISIINKREYACYVERYKLAKTFSLHLKNLGSINWNAAASKFIGYHYFLNDLKFRDCECVLSIDDDIRLQSSEYLGNHLEINMSNLIMEAFAEMPLDKLFARGAEYIGRVDACLELNFNNVITNDVSENSFKVVNGAYYFSSWYSNKPAVCCSVSPGISGAFLITNRFSLESLLLPACYNEDWIWLELLKAESGSVERISTPVIHAGGKWITFNRQQYRSQIEGAIIHEYFQRCRELSLSLSEFEHNTFEEICTSELSYIDDLLVSWHESLLNTSIPEALTVLNQFTEARIEFNKAFFKSIENKISQYLLNLETWRQIHLISKLSISTQLDKDIIMRRSVADIG